MGSVVGGGSGSGASLGVGLGGSFPSANVLRFVAVVMVVDGFELDSVRPEKVLESDCLGRADFDL